MLRHSVACCGEAVVIVRSRPVIATVSPIAIAARITVADCVVARHFRQVSYLAVEAGANDGQARVEVLRQRRRNCRRFGFRAGLGAWFANLAASGATGRIVRSGSEIRLTSGTATEERAHCGGHGQGGGGHADDLDEFPRMRRERTPPFFYLPRSVGELVVDKIDEGVGHGILQRRQFRKQFPRYPARQ